MYSKYGATNLWCDGDYNMADGGIHKRKERYYFEAIIPK